MAGLTCLPLKDEAMEQDQQDSVGHLKEAAHHKQADSGSKDRNICAGSIVIGSLHAVFFC